MNRRGRTIVHLSLGLAMLAVVVAAGLSPNTGVVQASSNCTYGQCTSSSQPFPLWAVASSVAAVVVALLLAFLILRRRRRPGQPPSEWEGPHGPGGAPPGAAGPEGPGPYETAATAGAVGAVGPQAGAEPMWQEGTSHPPSEQPPAEPSAEYLEPPAEPVPLPPPPAAPAAPPAPAAPVVPLPPPEEAEPDIDSLMAELEKISGEILKQKPKRKNGPPPSGPATDDTSP